MSNGSLNFSYKTSTNIQPYQFFEKDLINFIFNLKNKKITQNNDKFGLKYKNKYT